MLLIGHLAVKREGVVAVSRPPLMRSDLSGFVRLSPTKIEGTSDMQVLSPCEGRVIAIHEVNDPTFSGQLVGPGVGIEPADGRQIVAAPADGKLLKVDPHAFILLVDGGIGILVHIGINTVRLQGSLFEVLAEQGQKVKAGDPVVAWDPATVTDPDMERTVVVVLMDQLPDTVTSEVLGHDVVVGDALFSTI